LHKELPGLSFRTSTFLLGFALKIETKSKIDLCLVYLLVLYGVPFTTSASLVSPTLSPYGTLSISTAGNITHVTILNPPINLFDASLSGDLYAFLSSLDPSNRTTPPPKVVIFRSADPDFFIAHIDLNALLLPSTPQKTALLNQYVAVLRLLQSLTTTTFIAQVNGEAFAAGNELLVQMDMRFAGKICPNLVHKLLHISLIMESQWILFRLERQIAAVCTKLGKLHFSKSFHEQTVGLFALRKFLSSWG
jgi:hypothetical protein